MMSQNEIERMDAVALAAKVRKRELSATEVTEAVLGRMDKLEPHIHAFCTRTPELARKIAADIDKKIKAGDDPGPLAGVPVGIKDLVCTEGVVTASGSFAYKDFVPDEDDVVVERLKQAGGGSSLARPMSRNSATRRRPQSGFRNHAQSVES